MKTGIRQYAVDVLIVVATVALYATAWPTLHLTHVVDGAVAPAVAAFAAWPLLLLRLDPLLGWAVSAGSALVVSYAFAHKPGHSMPWEVAQIVCLIPLVCAVALCSPPPVVAAVWAASSVLFATRMPGSDAWIDWPITFSAVVLAMVLLRWTLSSRRALATQREATDLERARRTVLEEKARIARDLHDVVAHHMSMVVVQAQTARYRIPDLPEAATAEFAAVGETARTALNEIRALLGLLRSDGQLPEQAPQPGVAQLSDLIDTSRAAGMTVAWEVVGEVEPAPATVGLTAYRILQEALANAARHGSAGTVTARLVAGPRQLRLTVDNPIDAATSGAVEGHGIDGMRRRAAAIGGSVDIGGTTDGHFTVTAVLPRH